jgi:hypothetical protein
VEGRRRARRAQALRLPSAVETWRTCKDSLAVRQLRLDGAAALGGGERSGRRAKGSMPASAKPSRGGRRGAAVAVRYRAAAPSRGGQRGAAVAVHDCAAAVCMHTRLSVP